VVPLVATNSLPTPERMLVFVTAPPPATPPPPPATPPVPSVVTSLSPVMANLDAAPLVTPHEIAPQPPRELVIRPQGILDSIPRVSREPLVLTSPPALTDPLRVGGAIQPPRKIRNAVPIYPPAARAAKIGGIVIVDATIAKSGIVKNATILRGHPLLNQAALDAVTQWMFSPTRLNGEPVDVVMSVTVNFALQ
jgi:periplasmic protein TonB